MLNQMMRYIPLSRLVKKEGSGGILEVGGGESGINVYLSGKDVVGLDPGFGGDSLKDGGRFRQLKGSVLALPFKDASFPVVVCSDMLEHIAEGDRERAISELLRVTGKTLFLSFPVRETYGRWEQKLLAWYEHRGIKLPDWLADHAAKGLPGEAGVTTFLKRRGVSFETVSNENNLVHFLIMRAEASAAGKYLSFIAAAISPETWDYKAHGSAANLARMVFLPFRLLPLLLNFGSPVRKIFIIRKTAGKISGYYDSHPGMISSPFGGVGAEPGPGDAYLTETLAALKFDLRGKSVLDVGCGSGWFARYAKEKAGAYKGIDISARSVALSKKITPNVVQADAQALPFASGSFDCLFCIDSFEHIPDQDLAAREFFRVLNSGGKVFLSVPNYSNVAGIVKKLEETLGFYEKDSWAPFNYWGSQALEQFMTPGRVRDVFSSNGFTSFSVIGGKRDFVDGLFPWINHRFMPYSAATRTFLARFQKPLERFYWLSLHNFWLIGK
ncbi:MAG: hypothetical protein A2X32_06095 [Elusimicrobia bacterium GWC2_64_44]|nr:MAG: hypothetical protein A2X32_06095 [Elusimicrobia bacterium GWC2_64_44]